MTAVLKGLVAAAAVASLACAAARAADGELPAGGAGVDKAALTFGVTPVSKEADGDAQFGGAYVLLDAAAGNEYVTVIGKVYYRWNAAGSTDALAQKLDVKKAAVKVRPFGTELLELAIGKLYSYYLPGGYYSLAEIYTGASRWGKTGAGVCFSAGGVTGGLALPVTESYVAFSDEGKGWGLNGGLSYDVSRAVPSLPLSVGVTVLYNSVGDGDTDSCGIDDFSGTLAVQWSPRRLGVIRRAAFFAGYSYNAESYVSSSVFQNVSNYKSVGAAHLFSLNLRGGIGRVRITSENEAGVTLEDSYVPLYSGLQVQVPVSPCVTLKPGCFYYAALNTEDGGKSRSTYELYPKLTVAWGGGHSLTAGFSAAYREVAHDDFAWEYELPVYYKYTFK